MKWHNLITAVFCASAVPALAQSTAGDRIKSAYMASIQSAFAHHFGTEYIADGTVAAVIERSFPDCQIEETSLYRFLRS
jgi:hypothetical protein